MQAPARTGTAGSATAGSRVQQSGDRSQSPPVGTRLQMQHDLIDDRCGGTPFRIDHEAGGFGVQRSPPGQQGFDLGSRIGSVSDGRRPAVVASP